MAVAVQGLGFLESGITDPLNHFSNTLLEFSALLRHKVCLKLSGLAYPANAKLFRRKQRRILSSFTFILY